jgi:HSP20 family protein
MIFTRRYPIFNPFFLQPYPEEHIHPRVSQEKAVPDEKDNQVVSKPATENKVVRLGRNVDVMEHDDAWTLYMDMPGVKTDNVEIEEIDGTLKVTAERKRGDQVTATYQQHFSLDPRTTDPDHLSAELADGVLTITVPKKPEPEPITVQIEPGEAPEAPKDEAKEFRYTVDMPGVKPGDIKVEYRNDVLHLEAERKKGRFTSKIQRMFTVGPTVDMNHAKAYLIDGTLTLVAPRQEVGEPIQPERRKITLGKTPALKSEKE